MKKYTFKQTWGHSHVSWSTHLQMLSGSVAPKTRRHKQILDFLKSAVAQLVQFQTASSEAYTAASGWDQQVTGWCPSNGILSSSLSLAPMFSLEVFYNSGCQSDFSFELNILLYSLSNTCSLHLSVSLSV